MRAVGKLVLEYHGSLSGEHGDGLARSWFNAQLFGPEVYAEMVALKELFDPARLLAPGRVVEGPPPTEHLRLGPSYRARAPWRPRLDHGADGGFDLAVEKCFGAGLCKKLSGVSAPRPWSRATRRSRPARGPTCCRPCSPARSRWTS